MSRPPKTTVIFSNVPSDWIVGIDLQFFNSNAVLRGIKLIPDGIHVVHWAPDSSSVRSGFYFEAKEASVNVIYWDSANEKMLINEEIGDINVVKEIDGLSQSYPFMIAYPEDDTWSSLTRFIEFRQVNYMLPGTSNVMDSVLTSTDENNILLDAIKRGAEQRGTGNLANDPIVNSIIDQTEEEIKYTPIDLSKTVRPNSTPEEKTHDGIDKSWYLNNLITVAYNGNESLLLGEFQLAYINTIIFANYSSAMHWLKFLRVLFYCQDATKQKVAFFEKLLTTLCVMLEKFPEEYADEFVDHDFFEVSLAEFEFTVKDLNLHKLVKKVIDIKNVLLARFSINVQGIVEDEEDDGPVIVEL